MYTLKDFIFEHDFSPCTGLDVSTGQLRLTKINVVFLTCKTTNCSVIVSPIFIGHCTIDFDKFDQYMKVQDDPEVAGILQHK